MLINVAFSAARFSRILARALSFEGRRRVDEKLGKTCLKIGGMIINKPEA
jgi:hypothetical protein